MFKVKDLISRFQNVISQAYGSVRSTVTGESKLATLRTSRPATTDGAVAAALVRDMRHGNRQRIKLNSRGLPKGFSQHQVNRARVLKKNSRAREAATLIELENAQRTNEAMEAVKKYRAARSKPVPASWESVSTSRKFARRVMRFASVPTIKEIADRIKLKISYAKAAGRIPYRNSAEYNAAKATRMNRKRGIPSRSFGLPTMLRPANVKHRSDGTMVVTPA